MASGLLVQLISCVREIAVLYKNGDAGVDCFIKLGFFPKFCSESATLFALSNTKSVRGKVTSGALNFSEEIVRASTSAEYVASTTHLPQKVGFLCVCTHLYANVSAALLGRFCLVP